MTEEVIEGGGGGPYAVDRIIGIYYGKQDKKRYYHVKWACSWEPEENLSESCQRLIDEFWDGQHNVNKDDLKMGQKIIKREVREERDKIEEPATEKKMFLPTTAASKCETTSATFQAQKENDTSTSTDSSETKGSLKNVPLSSKDSPKNAQLSPKESVNKAPLSPNGSKLNDDAVFSDETNNYTAQIKNTTDVESKQCVSKVEQSVPVEQATLKETYALVPLKTTPSKKTIETQTETPSNNELNREAADTFAQQNSFSRDIEMREESLSINEMTNGIANQVNGISHLNVPNYNVGNQQTQNDLTNMAVNGPNNFFSNSLNNINTLNNFTNSNLHEGMQSNTINNMVNGNLPLTNNPVVNTVNGTGNIPLLSDVNNVNHHVNGAIEVTDDVIDIQESDDELEIVGVAKPRRKRGRPANRGNQLQRTPNRPQQNQRGQRLHCTPQHTQQVANQCTPPQQRTPNQQQNTPIQRTPNQHQNTMNYQQRMCQTNPTLSRMAAPATHQRSSSVERSNPVAALHPRRMLSYTEDNEQRRRQQPAVENSSLAARVSQIRTNLQQQTTEKDSPSKVLSGRTCTVCNHTFPNLTLARQHANQAHVAAPATCKVCRGIFPSDEELSKHMQLHTTANNNTGFAELHKCDVCLRKFKHEATLAQHKLIHSEELVFVCDICEKRFRQRGHLLTHMTEHEGDPGIALTCPRCASTYASPILYAAHMTGHERELNFRCRTCNEGFVDKQGLLLHLEGHNDERPFFCHICKKSFKTKSYLNGHIKTHLAAA